MLFTGKQTLLASDSRRCTSDGSILSDFEEKVKFLSSGIVWCGCGASSVIDAALYKIDWDSLATVADIERYANVVIAPAFRTVKNEIDSDFAAEILLGTDHWSMRINSTGGVQVFDTPYSYSTSGSGWQYAKGALDALMRSPRMMEPRAALEFSIRVAIMNDIWTGGNVQLRSSCTTATSVALPQEKSSTTEVTEALS